MTSAFDQLRLMRQARQDDREDLREIRGDAVGLAATTVLTLNQAKLGDLLLGADPNSQVDLLDDESEESDPPL